MSSEKEESEIRYYCETCKIGGNISTICHCGLKGHSIKKVTTVNIKSKLDEIEDAMKKIKNIKIDYVKQTYDKLNEEKNRLLYPPKCVSCKSDLYTPPDKLWFCVDCQLEICDEKCIHNIHKGHKIYNKESYVNTEHNLYKMLTMSMSRIHLLNEMVEGDDKDLYSITYKMLNPNTYIKNRGKLDEQFYKVEVFIKNDLNMVEKKKEVPKSPQKQIEEPKQEPKPIPKKKRKNIAPESENDQKEEKSKKQKQEKPQITKKFDSITVEIYEKSAKNMYLMYPSLIDFILSKNNKNKTFDIQSLTTTKLDKKAKQLDKKFSNDELQMILDYIGDLDIKDLKYLCHITHSSCEKNYDKGQLLYYLIEKLNKLSPSTYKDMSIRNKSTFISQESSNDTNKNQ